MSLARDAATSQVNTVPSGSNHGDSIGKSYAQVQRAESSEVDCKQLQEAELGQEVRGVTQAEKTLR
ncbi:hypothetical protein PPTG_24099 [Phytophthora nicotianae INRA-310]|uniref:Uncharacterized protein n=1 Tax=Phytophthora nicotianae (strain INRA-310) TaxID=761204 RepID=W2PK10_PHYN3|nr:hypothetical protein PPTG_24099 [Phytophthora nicotianae INRA-310]ETN01333.1 hypothetical protein PPTG_24099 [Phytophthora nicotianae INRA-310]